MEIGIFEISGFNQVIALALENKDMVIQLDTIKEALNEANKYLDNTDRFGKVIE